ncbi:hypothetical protein C6P45_004186 [Maudiozyma exigua]|uniref:Uncharacterized protein n=1 Tax=Maudiozyma exigua TaxID=34358 RepID=A0A9P6WBG9_MAUEX|nr:hypothetical protein C6P45_004186 [Kazachstania exigua]
MPQHIPIYAHYSSSSGVSPIKRVAATDISIEEEAEPCEKHDKIGCKECTRAQQSKMDQVLKRSISSNAVNNIKHRRSIANLHRTLSQTSVYSTGSTTDNTPEYDDFINLLSGDNYYNRADYLWDSLPSETKNIFMKQLIDKRHLERVHDQNALYNETKNIYKSGRGSVVSQILRKRNNTSRNQRDRHHSPQTQDKRNRIIREIADEIYDELMKDGVRQERHSFDSGDTQRRNSIHQETYLEHEKEQIDLKIKELNELIDKLSNFSPLVTPSTDEVQPSTANLVLTTSSISAKLPSKQTRQKTITPPNKANHKESTPEVNNNKNTTFMGCLSLKSKHFMNKFRHKKKKPAALNLYRSPNEK